MKRFFGIARCGYGHLGVVLQRKSIVYADGSSAVAFIGFHIWPLDLIGMRWSSRNPKWVWRNV